MQLGSDDQDARFMITMLEHKFCEFVYLVGGLLVGGLLVGGSGHVQKKMFAPGPPSLLEVLHA